MKELEELGELRRQAAEPHWYRVLHNILVSLKEAIPEPEPHCIHNCGPGFCEEKDCEFN